MKIPVVWKSSRIAWKATSPPSLIDGGRKPKKPNGPVVSATVVSGPPSPVTIAVTNSPVASSTKDVSKAAVPPSLRVGSWNEREPSAAGAAIVLKTPSCPTKMPGSKLGWIDSSNAMSPTLLIEGRESLPPNRTCSPSRETSVDAR